MFRRFACVLFASCAGRGWVQGAAKAFLVVACTARFACAQRYRESAQAQWADKSAALYADPDAQMLGGRGLGGGTRKIAPEDKKLLNQALDAFQQASHLEKELKKSERAVSAQTKELRTELAKAKATAASTGQTKYFRREERLDEELMKQAESETRRDKRLVNQAETEMKGDKKFLQTAYGIDDIDAYEARRKAKADSPDCGYQHCHQAKDLGLAPDKCVIGAGLCPRIQCYDYNPTTWCKSKQVCEKPASPKRNCFPKGPGRKSHWLKKTCPTMSCSQAKQLGYTPDFCTITMMEGICPQLKCFHYTDKGSCHLEDVGTRGSVCMKPSEADEECAAANGVSLAKSDLPRSGKRSRRSGSGSGWGFVKMAGGTTGIMCIIVFISLLAGSFFFLFKK